MPPTTSQGPGYIPGWPLYPGDFIVMNQLSTLGMALLALVALTTVVTPSSANGHQSFEMAHKALAAILSEASAKDVMRAYQRQTNTISIDGDDLDQPHHLTVSTAAGGSLQGTIEINGNTQIPLTSASTTVDLSPYLTNSRTKVVITGRYSPIHGSVAVGFEGPVTTVQQQTGGTGVVNYELNLVID